jgi:lactoylglutathione lyase
MRVNYAIVFVSDMERSVSFYRDVLELPLKFETTHWTEFATDGATIALHLSDGAENDPASPGHTAAGRCRPGFCVQSLDDFHRKMANAEVVCIQEPKETFGSLIAQYLDPDGLAFSVSEERIDG